MMTYTKAVTVAEWANSHDWSRHSMAVALLTEDHGAERFGVEVYLAHKPDHVEPMRGGHCMPDAVRPGCAVFYSMAKLRDWAGY